MKRIKIDHTKCIGCRLCEVACSLQHTGDTVNPKKSRIRVFMEGHYYYPVLAGPYTDAECNSMQEVVIGNQKFDACVLCRASCPTKPVFKEPEDDTPLKCDFCGDPPDPHCVKACIIHEALVLVDV